MEILAYLNIFLPLISTIIVGLFCRYLPKKIANSISCSLMLIATLCSIYILMHFTLLSSSDSNKISIYLFEWFFSANFTITLDKLAAVMLFIVTSVSCLVHLYSIGYMEEDSSSNRFMSYLSLFTFFMITLVVSDNFLQLFLGWEGVGLSSYLLIGFWFNKPQANRAAMKAFLVNRVADIAMILGIAIMFYLFKSLEFSTIFSALSNNISLEPELNSSNIFLNQNLLTIGCLALLIGCMGKSAQIILHVWLPDAMEGPTPVSALIHAATMVTAGVFMIARCSPLFTLVPAISLLMMLVGSITAIFAATIAMTQFDIKRIIAYSTCSQLGYMFAACGALAYDAAIFHLFTHAFFKALLFLGAGSVIHALHGEQDIRKMGNLRTKIPFTYYLMLVGTLAICGIYPLAGFYSKDLILENIFQLASEGPANFIDNSFLNFSPTDYIKVAWFSYIICLITVGLTSFYSWRLLILVFSPGISSEVQNYKEKVNHHNTHHGESPLLLIPMIPLALGAILSGILGETLGLSNRSWWTNILALPSIHPELSLSIKLLPSVVAVSGLILAHFIYSYARPITRWFTRKLKPVYNLVSHKYYFDEIYNVIFVNGFRFLSNFLWVICDIKIIDRFPNGIAFLSSCFGYIQSRLHTGKIYHYSWIIFIALMLLVYYGIIITTDEMTLIQLNG